MTTTPTLGVHSETGTLRQVIVARPGLAHRRLTPSNCAELLFDDVFWVKQAQKDHAVFTQLMRERGVEVLDVNDLLADTLDLADARRWVLDHRINHDHVGMGMLADLRAWLESPDAYEARLNEHLSTALLERGRERLDAGDHLGAVGCGAAGTGSPGSAGSPRTR